MRGGGARIVELYCISEGESILDFRMTSTNMANFIEPIIVMNRFD